MRASAPSLSAAPAHYPYEDPRPYASTDHASVKSGHEILSHQHGTSAYAPSTPAQSRYEDPQLYAFTNHTFNSGNEIVTHQSGYAPSPGPSMPARSQHEDPQVHYHANNGHEIPTYQHLTSGYAPWPPSSSAMSARSQYEDRQLYADHPSFNNRHEIFTHQHETLCYTPSSSTSMSARLQYEDPQHYAVTDASFNSGHELGTLGYRDATDAPLLSAVPAQSHYSGHEVYCS
ncbi:hypothetical protein BJV77DRAFT_485891 [Russula vinacea]|nr:hypothetical protein BJV77DRAFT_485891 [Russula vinacea]